jgi:hypothetical protein
VIETRDLDVPYIPHPHPYSTKVYTLREHYVQLGLPGDPSTWTEKDEQAYLDTLPSYCPDCGKRKFSFLERCPPCDSKHRENQRLFGLEAENKVLKELVLSLTRDKVMI